MHSDQLKVRTEATMYLAARRWWQQSPHSPVKKFSNAPQEPRSRKPCDMNHYSILLPQRYGCLVDYLFRLGLTELATEIMELVMLSPTEAISTSPMTEPNSSHHQSTLSTSISTSRSRSRSSSGSSKDFPLPLSVQIQSLLERCIPSSIKRSWCNGNCPAEMKRGEEEKIDIHWCSRFASIDEEKTAQRISLEILAKYHRLPLTTSESKEVSYSITEALFTIFHAIQFECLPLHFLLDVVKYDDGWCIGPQAADRPIRKQLEFLILQILTTPTTTPPNKVNCPFIVFVIGI